MLLNTWLTAAKRHLFNSSTGAKGTSRRSTATRQRPTDAEQLESRMLLTSLVINNDNLDSFVDASGQLSVTNADLGSHDTLVIEDITLNSSTSAISVDLSNIALEEFVIESVDVTGYTGTAIDIDLQNVTGNRTISLEDIDISVSDGIGLNLNLDNADAYAVTIEDSVLPGIIVSAINGSTISHGIVTENEISAPADSSGVALNVNTGGAADDFRIVNNVEISTLNGDAVRIDLDDAPVDGLVIANNVIGNEPGADVFFRAEGDTFVQPFELTSRAGDGEVLEQFVLDLRPLGLVFDADGTTGKPFTVDTNRSDVSGTITPTLTDNNQVLTIDFDQFASGQSLFFTIDVDTLPAIPTDPPVAFTALGNHLIGAPVSFDFGAGVNSGAKQVTGTLVGDPDVLSASEFARGGGETGANSHGINLNLSESPLTNVTISGNTVTGVAGHGILVGATQFSDVSGVFSGNSLLSGGQDGIRFDLVDSNFIGGILDNQIGGNTGHGVAFKPSVTRTGSVEGAIDSSPVVITSTNHQLQTGDQIIVQGMVNDDPTVNHPGNGLHTVTRVDNNRFELQGVNGQAANVTYAGGGSWYVPDFQGDGSARGLVSIDLQATEPQGRVQDIQAPSGGGDAIITSVDHGLSSGDRVRISRADGTGISGTQSFEITVVDSDTFTLDGQAITGTYDTSAGLANWTTNIVENTTSSGEIVVTSSGHGLQTGDQIRVVGVRLTDDSLSAGANGHWTITRLTDDTFTLQNSQGNGTYVPGSGYWTPFAEATFTGDELPQLVSGNSFTGNGGAGFYVDLSTGTRFDGDIVTNDVSGNSSKGIHIESHSFGLGRDLPLDPNDDSALPNVLDNSFDVNIGTSATDGNTVNSNEEAGIVIEALDSATGSFEIRGNQVNANTADTDSGSPYVGDGISVRLGSDQLSSEATALLSESVIADNQIGVDNRGNLGNGLSFEMGDRTRIQDLEVLDNNFLNNSLDGFHFVREEDADLNSVLFDDNISTNNAGDGYDIFAENTVKDRLDFQIRDSIIDNNGEYGVRIDVQADARVQVDIEGSTIRQNGRLGNGFSPNDNDAAHPDGNAQGESGGVGIRGFQQVDIALNVNESVISENTGDGVSIDATNFFDTVIVNASFVDSTLNLNSRAGLRSIGTSFGQFELTRSDFNGNLTDGARFISNLDANDFFDRRVGGQDIDIIGMGNNFQANGYNGLILGQGVSGVFGNGDPTSNFRNQFGGRLTEDLDETRLAGMTAGNGADGLKIVQDAGPYLRNIARRRVIQTDGNEFTFNAGAGVDIGHDVASEGNGNVLHGYEVVSDTDIIINRGNISNNQGDGVEYLADNVLRQYAEVGSGQDDIEQPDITSLSVSNSDVKNNEQRGIDILNRYAEESRVTLTNNEVIGNGYSGIYVVNTSSHVQLQGSPDDPLEAELFQAGEAPSDRPGISLVADSPGLPFDIARSPNIELRVQDNLIESNGTADVQSRVPINDSGDNDDGNALAHTDFYHTTNTVNGTLGGLVIRVGTADTTGEQAQADPAVELGNSGIDAEVWNNNFDGNFGADVYFDSFVSIVPNQTAGIFTEGGDHEYRWDIGFRDPLARFDLVFRENTGNSLDVVNGFAFLDNTEELFKSRIDNDDEVPLPNGPFNNISRSRNATRTLGYFNNVGDVPASDFIFFEEDPIFYFRAGVNGEPSVTSSHLFAYDGWGTPTWRVESDFVGTNNFTLTEPVSGHSDFFDEVNLGAGGLISALAEAPFQWDTGVNAGGFVGATPYSLERGDVFGVQAGESPIAADSLEENDGFASATRIQFDSLTEVQTPVSGTFSVNALADNGNLNIERKGDRDYYQFIAAATGSLNVDVSATDAIGDSLQFLIYEVDRDQTARRIPMVQAVDGAPIRSTVTPGSSGRLTVSVVEGRSYIVEIMSDERTVSTRQAAKNFVYGTVRSYSLSIDAPVAPAPVLAAPATEPAPIIISPFVPGITAAISVADASPFVQSITDVSPDPIGTSINSLTVTFSEDVTGVSTSNFTLTRDGQSLDLSGVIINSTSADTYELTNLSPLTNQTGTYVLSLIVSGSGIIDTDNVALIAGANDSETWTLDNTIGYTSDVTDNIPGDGIIGDAAGNASLRAAIMETNANAGDDIINLDAGTYTLSLGGRFEDGAATGDLDIRDNVTIRGTGATALDTIIDAAQLDRVFHVYPGVQLTLENLTIQGGEAYDGAGIFVEGRKLFGETGDGSSSGLVTLTDVNIIDNEAYNQGGGIYNLGTVDALRSSISRNAAGSRGGGIFNHGSVELLNSTISTNTAVSRGGGFYNEVSSSAVVSGTINPDQAVGIVRAFNSTIAFNSAQAEGGGFYQELHGTVVLGNSIVEQNTASSSPDLSGNISSAGHNFIGNLVIDADTAGLLITDTAANQTSGVTSAGLNALTSAGANGTWVHTLATDAFAVDAGSNSVYATEAGIEDTEAALLAQLDQSGSPRLVEADGDGEFAIDIGASEQFLSQPVAIIEATPNPAGINETILLDASTSTHTLVPGTSKIVLFEWDLSYDGTTFNVEQSGVTTSASYPATGSYTIALRVTDDTNATDLKVLVLNVSAPLAPEVLSPLSDGTSDLTPTIEWTEGTGNYALVLTNIDTNQVVIDESGLTETTYTPSTDLTPGTYEAVVTASNASGSESSVPYRFEVIKIALTDPLNFDVTFDTTPEFTFTAIPNARWYQVWVSQVSEEVNENGSRDTVGIPINDSRIDASQALVTGTDMAVYEAPESLGKGLFRVWVRAFEADGNAGHWSVGNQFSISQPEVTGPVSVSRTTLDNTPTITWTDLGANQYEVWLSQRDGTVDGAALTSPQVVFNDIVQGTSWTPDTPLGDGNFRVWVRAVADNGEAGLWSEAYDFKKDLPNTSPTLLSPIEKVTTTDRTPIFEWQALDDASHYEIWVNKLNGPAVPRIIHNKVVPHIEGAATITFTDPDIVLRNASYRWWVRAFNEDGDAAGWSAPEVFWVPAPAITSPTHQSTINTSQPTFTWSGVPEYVRYELWVNNVTTETSRVVYEPNLTTQSYTATLPVQNGEFKVWVRAFDADGNASQWSSPASFTTDASIDEAPLPQSPGYVTNDNTPQFVWSPPANAVRYEILVKNLLATSQPEVLREETAGTLDSSSGFRFYDTTTNLDEGLYRWWIRGINTDEVPGAWSQPLDFRIVDSESTQPSIPLPENDVMVATLRHDEQWADDLHSITVHPAAVIAARLPAEDVSPVTNTTTEMPVAVTDDVDAVMQELAVADWWATDNVAAQTTDNPSVHDVADQSSAITMEKSDGNTSSAAALGLVMAAFGGKRGRKGRRKE